MSTKGDWLWPGYEGLCREIEWSRRLVRREAARRRREARREFAVDALALLVGLALAIFVMWLVVPAWYPQ